jgi:lipoprotein-anchoring transpeptidase ErfK/SrfK
MPSRRSAAALALLLAIGLAAAAPRAQATPAARPKHTLTPGQFTWHPERAPHGPVVVIVNVPDQMAYVYRNGIRIGQTTVSTGRPGHATPTGVFTILEKQTVHHSNLYDSAPMPYMERLTWGGVCLHAGGLPGYPSSHGCVHLPLEFAKLLYGVTERGTTVVVADGNSAPSDVLHPTLLEPSDVPGQTPEAPLTGTPGAGYAWDPSRSPEGPLSILISQADARVYVYRNGIEIGSAALRIEDANPPLVHAVYTMLEGTGSSASILVPGRPSHRWMRVDLLDPNGKQAIPDPAERVHLPPAFAAALYDALTPGTTLLVTDRAVTPQTTGSSGFVVMQAGEQPAAAK